MVASRRRLIAVFLCLVALAAFPILASAATADFRVLIDNLPDVGCNEGGMTGVDTILVTRVVTTDTSAQETRIYRQVCTAGVFGPPVDLDLTARPAGLQTPSGLVLLETRIPYSAVPGIETRSVRLGFDATDGFFTQHVLTQPNGSPIMYPAAVGRRHSANTPGTRNFVLDGNGNDWINISPLVTGMASDGATAVRMIRIFAVANTADDFIYFRFDSFVDNSGPFAQDDTFARKVGQGLAVNAPGVLGNDGDPNGKPLTATPVSSPSHGSVVLNPDGSFTYTPDNPTSDTQDKFNYKANNGTKDSNVAEVTIKVSNKSSSAPIANDDAYNTPEDTPLNVAAPGVLANDVDADGPSLTATLLTNPSHGSVVLSSNGAFTYNPAHNFFGTDTFTYRVTDGTSNDDAIVTITIGAVNDAPVAQNINRTTNEDNPVSVTLSATDPEGSALTWQVGSPSNGVLSGSAPNLTYTPNPNFFGTDSFTYTVKDSSNKISNTATVTITVNPVNDAPSFSCGPNVIADSSLGAASFPGWATGISAGPANESGQTLTSEVTANSNPGLFTVQPSFNASGTLTFTPVAGATGSANITIRLRDNGGTANGGVDVSGSCSFTINVDASPTVQSTTPANGASGVALNSNVTITFSESVTVAGTWFSIACGTSGTHNPGNSGVSGGPATFTIDPTDFTQGESCTATVFASQVTDNDAIDPPNNMAANYVFTFTIDAQPTVASTTPLNGAVGVPLSSNVTITFSEPVNVTGVWFQISCGASGLHDTSNSVVTGGPTTFTINPTDFTENENCTATIFAANVTDQDSSDPPDAMAANYVFSFSVDAAPTVTATTPTNGSFAQPNTDFTVTFSEPVSVTTSSFTISCGTSGSHTFALTGGPTTWTLNPNVDFTAGESCTITVLAAQVSDTDTNDPPDNMVANYVFSVGFDAAPSVTSTTPTNGATGVPSSSDVTVNFSENVTLAGNWFSIVCGTSGTHDTGNSSVSGGPASYTINPTDFTQGESCTATIFAAQVTDNDANDPPDNMNANYVFSFTIDAAPSVTTTTPANGAVNQAANANVTVNFSEPVNATTSSFTISCTTSGAHTFSLSSSPSATFTLNPTADFTEGETCTVTVVAAQVTDVDANDPPDNMLADYVFSFSIDAAPSVTAVTPTNGSVNVATNTNLSVTFSEPVTITNSSVTISCANTGAHTVTVSGGPTTWTVDPTSDFGNGELCTATVVAAQVSDNDSNDPPDGMNANFVWSFTTDNPPSVTATTPTNGGTSSPDTNITVTFDEAVNTSGSSFTISCTTSGAHTFALSGGPTTFTLDPTVDFTGGETCTVTVVAAQVTDTDAGDPPDNMAANYVFSFGVDAAPSVTSTTPTNGATGVAGNANVVINFSESVNASGASFDITCATSGAHTFSTSASPSATFTLDPTADFTQGETCTVTVFAAGVTDVDAFDPPDNMAANYVFSFTVDQAPSVTSTTPTNGATDIGAATNVTINFSEPVNATGASFDITCATSGAHTFSTSSSPSATFTLDPTADFTAGETCTVTVFAAGITDADANDPPDNMLANYVFSFTMDAAPSVNAVTPTNGSTGIATNTNLSVTFSEPVTITNSSVTISCANTGAHTVTVSGGPTTWTVDPTSDFGNGELCTATVLAAQVSDNDSNDPPDNMLANFVWSFTTDNPPSVMSTTPVNGGTTSPDTNVSITFDEAVNATASSFTVSCTTSGSHAFALSGGPTTFTLDPTVDFTGGETCTVTVVAAQVTDQDAGDPPDNMVSDYVFTFSIDAAPTVVSTTPTNGSIDNATNVAIVINYSEPVTAGGTAYTITCPSTRAFTLGGNGTATHTLTPTINLPPGATCTVSILAAQITDTDTNDPPDNMAANYSFSFSLDQAPFITATSPNDGSTGIATNTNIQITWNESVTLSSAGISCATSGSHTSVITGNPGSVSTINPDTDFVPNELCTITILNTAVSDTDTNDPPDNMGPTYSFQFTTDAAPSVSSVTPTDTSTGIATNTNLSIMFSEPVTITNSSVTISCANTGAHTVTVSGGPTTWTVDPNTDFGNGELCTATVLAAQVSDNDAGDPPDNMAANFVWSFTTDTPPSVTATTPTNASVSVPATDITVTFSEPVNATGSSFTISCATSGSHTFALSGGPTTWTLNPNTDFTEGETCTVTVVAAQVTDTDAGDPPDNMVSDYVFTFSIDSAPTVVTTTPANSPTPDQASNVNIVITYSEPVTASGTAYTIKCTPSNTARPFVLSGNGTAVHTLDPNTNLPAGQTCTVSILAAQITDVDSNDPPDNMAADYSFAFHVDANPQIVSTSPVDGSTVATNTNVGITWTEPVNMTTVNINCTTSGAHTSVLSTSDNITWTVNPNTDFTPGEVCTILVLSASVTDVDTADPPDNPGPDISWQYTVDTAPTVTSTTPTDLATQQANNANITVNFSESVAATTSSFTISCATSGAHAFSLSSSPSTSFTLDPSTDFTNGEQCTVTVVANQISDSDSFDPPDNMAANYVFTFTVDVPPTVTTTTPTNGQNGVAPTSTITVNFSESVNATTSSFTINCGGAQTFTLSSSPSTSFTLTPTSNLPAVLCTVTVVAAQITDADAGDPPDNMVADYVFSFTVNTPPTAVDDVDNAIGNLTLTVPDNDGVLVNGADGSGADTDPDPGATITVQSLGPLTGSQGGTITFTPGGGFTYHSEAGDQNVDDVFTYTIVDNNGATDTGQLTIHVGPRYLFVDANFAGAPKDGRDTNPFQTLQQAETGSAANDTFVVKQGAYTDFITLKNGQVMYGNGASAALTTTFNTELFTVFTPTGTHPTFKRSTAGNTITLASGNTLRGIDVSASSGGSAIAGTNFGTLTVTESRIGVGQTNPAPALTLDNGTLAANFQTVNSTAGLNGISCTTCAGNLTVGPGGTLSGATGDEFLVTGNTPTVNINYSGSITYAGANSAIRFATTAGTYNGNVTFDTGALNVTGGTAINVSATAAGSTGTHNYYTASGTATITGAVTGINLGTNADGTYTFGPAATPANFAITNTTGTSFLINGNASKVTYRGNITQGNAQTMVGITNHAAAGTATFSVGTLNSTAGTGVSLNNADGTESFNGTATLNGATGISITNGTGGTVSFGSGTSITTATAPFVLDGTGTAVNGAITYSGVINETAGSGTLLNINTLSGSLTFNGTTLTGSTNAGPGWLVVLANITGTLTTNHLNINDSNNNFGPATMVSLSGTNTGGTLNFHHMILSANGTTAQGAGLVASGGGTLNITNTGGNSSITTKNAVGLSLNGQALTNGSNLNSITVAGGAGTVNGITMTNVTGGTFTIAGGSIAGATGATFNVSGGTATVVYNGTIAQANANPAISVVNHATGTLTFGGNVTPSADGADLFFDNADGTYNLNATNTLTNGAGVNITNGSGGTFSFSTNTSITNGLVDATDNACFRVDASSPGITYSGNITKNGTANGRLVDIQGQASGTITFQTGTLSATSTGATSTGIGLDNADGTVNFNGTNTLNGGNAGVDIIAGSSGTFVFSATTTITSPSGTAFAVAASSPTVTYPGTITQNTAGQRAIDYTTLGGGTSTFSGAITSNGGTGVSIEGTGGTVDISGQLALNGTGSIYRACNGTCAAPSGTGLTVSVTNANNTIGATTAATTTGLTINRATIGASGVQFDTVNVNGGTNGILLSNTGNTGGTFVINGTGTDNSGGLITGTTGDGVSLNTTRNITLTELQINNSTGSAIDATSVTNLTLTNTDFDTSSDHGFNGSSITNLTVTGGVFNRGGAGAEPTCNFNGFNITNLLGTNSVSGATFTRSNTIQFRVNNTATSGSQDTLTVNNTQWNTHTGPCAGDHLSVNADTGGNFKLIMNATGGKNVVSTGGSGVQVSSGGGAGNMAADITGLQTSGNTAGVVVAASGTSSVAFNVHGNKTANTTGFSGTGSVALILTCTTSGTCQGQFDDNTITHTAGTGTNAMQVVVEGNGTGKVIVSNNVVSGNCQRCLHAQQRGGTGTGSLALTVTGNSFTGTDAAGLDSTNFETSFSGDTTTLNTMCLNLANNSSSLAGGGDAYRLFNRTGDVFQLQNFAGNGNLAGDVQTWVTTTKSNTGTPVNVTVNATYQTSALCAQPVLP